MTAGEWPATVRIAEHLGSDTFVYAEADGIGQMTVRLSGEAPNETGQRIFLTPQESKIHKFDKEGLRIPK
jgi:multiple sugar transport system ATP-binding protein